MQVEESGTPLCSLLCQDLQEELTPSADTVNSPGALMLPGCGRWGQQRDRSGFEPLNGGGSAFAVLEEESAGAAFAWAPR